MTTVGGSNTIILNSIVGPTGPTGPEGPAGATGSPGTPGATGPMAPFFMNISIGNGIDVITTNQKNYTAPMIVGGMITAWSIAETSETPIAGSIVLSIFCDPSASTYPPTTAISGTEKPTLSTQKTNSDATLTTWTTAVNVGDCLGFNVDSCTGCKRVAVVIRIDPTS